MSTSDPETAFAPPVVASAQRGLSVDVPAREAVLDGQVLTLTKTEFDLLAKLSASPRAVITFDMLMNVIGNGAWYSDTHAVQVHMSRLRQKLGESGTEPRFIHTVRGIGYRFEPEANTVHGAVGINQVFKLVYDHELILRSIEPDNRSLLGWEPSTIIDTFFMLTSVEAIHSDQEAALAFVRSLVAAGILVLDGAVSARTYWGSVVEVKAINEILVGESGKFHGMRSTVTV